MSQKILFLADPGIDGAFALTLALSDPDLEVLGIAATAGNVKPEQATRNIQVLVEQLDPARWPRLGAALPVTYDHDGSRLHGSNGLGGVDFPCAQLHHMLASDKLIVDIIKQYPKEVTVIAMGPLTALARAIDLHPELPALVKRLVCVGGTHLEPGNVGPVSETHFYCDPPAARQVIRCGAPLTLLPLDLARKVLLSPRDLLDLPSPESRACQFLGAIVPFGIGASSRQFGIEGFCLKDVLGVAAVAIRNAIATKPMAVDIETRGELTRGMSVIDARPGHTAKPNVEMGVGVDAKAIRDYMRRILESAL